MDRLREAVNRGIITEDQRRAIEALRPDPLRADAPGLSLVHVLWMAGCALVVFAMVLLAIELGADEPGRLMWIGIAYAGVFAALDQVVKPRATLRLLSSMLVLSMAACLSLAVIAWQATVGEPSFLQDWSDPPWWSRPDADPPPLWPYSPLIHGAFLPAAPVLAAGAVLLVRRAFLPAWVPFLAALILVVAEVWNGLGLDDAISTRAFFLGWGIALSAAAWWADLRDGPNHGFWLNKVAMTCLAVWSMFFFFDDRMGLFLMISIATIAFAIYIRRPAGVSVGAMGIAAWLADWFNAWENLIFAAVVLGLIGFASIVLGVRAHLIEDRLDDLLPEGLRRLRPPPRAESVTFGL
jgi:hypothetical protein